jgi:hypothetical protein
MIATNDGENLAIYISKWLERSWKGVTTSVSYHFCCCEF